MTPEQLNALKRAAQLELGKTSVEDFCKYNIKIVDKAGKVVPFVFNDVQKELQAILEEELAAKGMARIVVLKARQEGVSTWAQGVILHGTAQTPNETALVMAHRADGAGGTKAIFEKLKFMYRHMPEDIRPLKRASNAYELIFDTPTGYRGPRKGLNSRTYVQTAGGDDVGRGDTYRKVHFSEAAFYPGGFKRHLESVSQAVPKLPGTIFIIETTANGFNDFKDFCDDAMNGLNDWRFVFLAWFRSKDNQMPVTDKERKEIMGSLNEYETMIHKMNNLTAEQIKWYRYTLKNDFSGDVNKMKQENPSFPEEAFVFSGRPVFNVEKVRLRIEALRNEFVDPEKAPKVGRFTFEWKDGSRDSQRIDPLSVKFVEDPNGWVKIYEAPQKGHPYTIGGDTKGEGHDFYTATVRDNSTGKRVATLKMQLNTSRPYTRQIEAMGYWYNMALIGVEMNWNTAPVEDLEEWRYPRQYIRQVYDAMGKPVQAKYGWRTDGHTRPLIIDREVDMVENHIELFTDIETLEEMLTFVYDEDGRPDAMDGKHDDLLFSDMIAQEIGSQQTTKVETEASQRVYNFDIEKPRQDPFTGAEPTLDYLNFGG